MARLTRRQVLAGAGLAGAGAAAGAVIPRHDEQPRPHTPASVPFRGVRQAGIATPPQQALHFAAFDLTAANATDLQDLLREWTRAAARLCSSQSVDGGRRDPHSPPGDPGEALGLEPASLTLTFGFGPTLFGRDGEDRLGLAAHRPGVLSQLPDFAGEALEARRSDGDLCVQACADDPQAVFHAIHALALLAQGVAVLRWSQLGFAPASATRPQSTPRNLMGFKDGTNNVNARDQMAMNEHVWVGSEGPGWMLGGTYLVARRIRMLFDVWDRTTLGDQERAVGRRKASGAPLGALREHDRVDLDADAPEGPVIPADAHIRLAAPQSNGDLRLLRRSYSFSDGIDQDTDQLDAGLFFVAFQRDPQRQFVPIQRRLATDDALNRHLLHTGSAVFALPRGTRAGGYIGETLFSA